MMNCAACALRQICSESRAKHIPLEVPSLPPSRRKKFLGDFWMFSHPVGHYSNICIDGVHFHCSVWNRRLLRQSSNYNRGASTVSTDSHVFCFEPVKSFDEICLLRNQRIPLLLLAHRRSLNRNSSRLRLSKWLLFSVKVERGSRDRPGKTIVHHQFVRYIHRSMDVWRYVG